jgi:cytochrome P450
MWNNNRIMRNYLLPQIERTVAERLNPDNEATGPKTVISLAVQAYLASTPDGTTKSPAIDSHFLDVLIAQLKVFMLAGYDTTAATLTFAYHLLYTHPHVLAAVRQEHSTVFGPDPSAARDLIASSPQLLNQLPYTTAVLKETLRLYPPAATIRAQPDSDTTFHLTNPTTGKTLPTHGFMLLDSHFTLHRNPRVFARAHEFVPERFLAREGDPLHVRKNAFRAFGIGPRACLGQELALLELKAVLAMTVREFDLAAVLMDGPGTGEEVLGARVYQTQAPGQPTPHPKGGLVVRVRERVAEGEE